ncbi:uncharacterized protein LOC134701406 [Mytilus trossulus]|uniref:uncharacterized protein LOC134701406 n=1 Tax=Mytilus trossulus TaxID=6551 RepID=UPI0030063CB1
MEDEKEFQQPRECSKTQEIDDLYQSVAELYSETPESSPEPQKSTSLPSWSFSPIPNTGIHLCQPRSTTPNEYSYNYSDISNHSNAESWPYPMYNWYYAANYMHSRSVAEQQHQQQQQQPQPESVKPEPGAVAVYNMPTYNVELSRCSTPELISVLANLPADKQDHRSTSTSSSEKVPSNSRHHYYYSQSSSMCASQNASHMYLQMAGGYQDSGYNSDLNMSPVYPYQQKSGNNSQYYNVKSTESAVKSAESSDEDNKENDIPQINEIPYDQYDRNDMTPEMTSSVLNLANYSDELSTLERQIQSSDISSSEYPATCLNRLPKLPESSLRIPCKMPSSAVGKRKLSETTTNINLSSKRQRHNQPLNNDAIKVMMTWYETHRDSPYPNKAEKDQMAKDGGISVTQVKSWFANKRNRNNNTRPKVQKRQMEERLMDICHQLARDAKHPSMNNADLIQQLSSIITIPSNDI